MIAKQVLQNQGIERQTQFETGIDSGTKNDNLPMHYEIITEQAPFGFAATLTVYGMALGQEEPQPRQVR